MDLSNLLASEGDPDTSGRSSQRRSKRSRCSYVPPSLVLKVFPGVETEILVKLSELYPPTPAKLLALVPGASSTDIAKFFDVLNGPASSSPGVRGGAAEKGNETAALVTELKHDLEHAEDSWYRLLDIIC